MGTRYTQFFVLLSFLCVLNGCSGMMAKSFMRPTLANLQQQTDLELVCEGVPSFLLMLESMVASNPNDKSLLLSAVQAFSGYSAALEECGKPERARTVSRKARTYGLLLLSHIGTPEQISRLPIPELEVALARQNNHVERLFWAGNGLATWISYQQGSPESMVQLARVEKIMTRVLQLDETYHYGGAHLFFGTYYASKPTLLGGDPEKSRHHFEQALAIADREFLPALVLYAGTYAKMTFNRSLFTDLLQEALDFPLEKRPDIALTNQIAKRRAAGLLEQADQFF